MLLTIGEDIDCYTLLFAGDVKRYDTAGNYNPDIVIGGASKNPNFIHGLDQTLYSGCLEDDVPFLILYKPQAGVANPTPVVRKVFDEWLYYKSSGTMYHLRGYGFTSIRFESTADVQLDP